jgi:single-stranded-DNA-specific exonuclease
VLPAVSGADFAAVGEVHSGQRFMTVSTGAPMDPPTAAPSEAPSLTGRRWIQRDIDDRLSLALSQRHNLSALAGRVLAARGVDLEGAKAFLDPKLRVSLPDPDRLRDMGRAAQRIVDAIDRNEPIAVFADYDVDGATSAAILHRFLSAVDRPPMIYVPDRQAEGYGPNAAALAKLRDAGARLVLTVDCGTTAFETLAEATRSGLDIVVLDHHTADAGLPDAYAVVNPNRIDESGELHQLAACGVSFLVAVEVNRRLRTKGHFAERDEPKLMDLLDLVAVGTVCDVASLTGVNRALVAQGLKVLSSRRNPGLAALADIAGVSARPDATDVGFALGPRINAGGRVGRSDLGCRLLCTGDAAEARELAVILDQLNVERRAIERTVLDAATAQVEADVQDWPVIVVGDAGWHQGVIGIVAARLRERFDRPACVLAVDGSVAKGSGRSVPGFDLGTAVRDACRNGLALNGGGHPMAAGFSISADGLSAFRAFLCKAASDRGEGGTGSELQLDGALTLGATTTSLATELARFAPFGRGNPEPRFALRGVRVRGARRVGDGHVACTLYGEEGGSLSAIAFRAAASPLGAALMVDGDVPLHFAGVLQLREVLGRMRLSFRIDDAAPVWGA